MKKGLFLAWLCCTLFLLGCPSANTVNGGGEEGSVVEPTTLFPMPGATSAFPDGELMIVFDSPPTLTEDMFISIFEQGGGDEPIDTIRIFTQKINQRDMPDRGERQIFGNTGTNPPISLWVAGQMTRVEGNKLFITPHHDRLEYGRTYYVVIPPGAITGATFEGDAFAGIGPGEWSFTTRTAPILSPERPITVDASRHSNNSADFRTIYGALNAIRTMPGDWTINVAPGRYYELIHYRTNANQSITINGTGTERFGADVVIEFVNHDSINPGTHNRASFYIAGPHTVVLKNISVRNLAGRAGGQAEALHVTSSVNRLVVYNSGFFSFQDTILTSADRAWFFRCYIEGDTDYIWGSPSVALFEECVLVNVEGRAGHLFVSRVGRGATVPKGFVAFNSEVSTLSPNATFGRTLPSGAAPNHTTWCQAAIINSTVDGQFRNGLWQVSHDSRIGNGEHVGFKVFGLTNPDGSDFDVSNIASGTSVLERHHFEREYNGRHVILNRVFRPETGRYEFASEIWDISHWETLFNAPADPSRDNVFDSIYVEEIIVEDVSLAIGQSANVSFQVLPMDAEVRRVTWESDNPAIVGIDSDTGRITGYTGGTATITARATDGSGVYGTAAITVMANVELWTLHWDFTTVPEGWSTGDTVVVQPTDAYFGDGMTLLSRTGSDAAPTATSPDYGNGVQMVIDPNAAALAFDGDLPFTRGRMRINRGTFARIEGIQGPYTITINFHAANNAAADRFPVVKIGDVSHNLVGDPNHVPSAMGGAASQLQVRYNGTGSPVIYLKMNGGGRIWDVYIEGIREL